MHSRFSKTESPVYLRGILSKLPIVGDEGLEPPTSTM